MTEELIMVIRVEFRRRKMSVLQWLNEELGKINPRDLDTKEELGSLQDGEEVLFTIESEEVKKLVILSLNLMAERCLLVQQFMQTYVDEGIKIARRGGLLSERVSTTTGVESQIKIIECKYKIVENLRTIAVMKELESRGVSIARFNRFTVRENWQFVGRPSTPLDERVGILFIQ